jgi:DNA-directed RNA polymerase subunit A"
MNHTNVDEPDEPGTSVGMIASQSIGQPTIQMTLSSFHHVGTSSKKIVEGIPRLEEIINLSANNESSSCNIHLNRPVDLSEFLYTTIKELVDYYYIEEDLNSWWYDIAESELLYKKPSMKREGVVFRIVFDKQKLYLRRLSLFNLLKKIKDMIVYDKFLVMISPEHLGIIDIANSEGYKRKNIRLELYQIAKEIIFPIVITPIKIYNAEINGLVITTLGTDLKNVLGLEFVDYTKTTSNSIPEIFKIFGIEAARKAIVIELSKTLNGYVTFSDKHINLIADFMTHTGKLIPMNSAGVSRQSKSCLAKASYERTMKEFFEACCFGSKDYLGGMGGKGGNTERIIVGARANAGTGSFEIYDQGTGTKYT